MKTSRTLTLGAIAVLGLASAISAPNALAQQKSPLVGTWRVTSSRPYGEHVIGYLQYSPGGHMVAFVSTGTPKRAAGTAYTDAERLDIHKGIFGAYAGTYSVEGNKVIHHVVASWLPEWIGGDQIRYTEIEGNRLTIKTAPQKNPAQPREYVATVTFERVE